MQREIEDMRGPRARFARVSRDMRPLAECPGTGFLRRLHVRCERATEDAIADHRPSCFDFAGTAGHEPRSLPGRIVQARADQRPVAPAKRLHG